MQFNWEKIKKSTPSYLIKLTAITSCLIILSLTYVIYAASPVTGNSNVNNKISSNDIPNINTPKKTIIIVNGQPKENYLINSLKKQGFFLINLVTPTLKISPEDLAKAEGYYDKVIVQNNTPETLEALKLLFKAKGCAFKDALTTQQSDVVLVDIIRESFNKPFNGEAFRNLNQDKVSAIKQLNKILQTQAQNQLVTVEEFAKAILKQTLPCSVKVMSSQQTLATYFIGNSRDIEPILVKLKNYKTSDIKIWLQPFHENLYRLQTTSFNNKTVPVALWQEKTSIKGGEVREDARSLINLNESLFISQDKLAELSQRLAEGMHLNHGLGEFVLALHENQVEIVDYNLALPNHNQIEAMEQVLGYSPLSYHLMNSALVTETPLAKKEFKNIIAVKLHLNNKNDLLKLSMMPTFYRFYPDKEGIEEDPIVGELYLVHTDKNLVVASYAGIKNTEQSLLNPMFSSHSATNIVNFYREAAANKTSDYTLNKDGSSSTVETKEALEKLQHESQHIPRYVKPLNGQASIQDIMHYYIDIYDLYILHGKPPGTKVTPKRWSPKFGQFSSKVKL